MALGAPERGVGKGRLEPLRVVLPAVDGAATVVEVEVGQEDVGDVVAVEAEGIELGIQVLGAGGIMAEELLALLVAHAAIDEHQAVALLDQQGAQSPIAAVPLVGGVVFRPEGLRDHAEHGAAVELEQTVGDRVDRHGRKVRAARGARRIFAL